LSQLGDVRLDETFGWKGMRRAGGRGEDERKVED
jgi:hypothetical protein